MKISSDKIIQIVDGINKFPPEISSRENLFPQKQVPLRYNYNNNNNNR